MTLHFLRRGLTCCLLVAAAISLADRDAAAVVERSDSAPPAGGPLITFSETNSQGQLINYLQANPQYTFTNVENLGQVTVSFGSIFEGQTAGSMMNSLSDTSPSSPLRLDPNGAPVGVVFDGWASDRLVLGGMDLANYKMFTTPIAIHFSTPVNWVGFDVGSFDHDGTTVFEAYDANGLSLGSWLNTSGPGGFESVHLRETSQSNNISGISVYVPADGMDWEGFSIDNVTFGGVREEDPPNGEPIPEPSGLLIWALLIGLGLGGQAWWKRRAC